MIASAKPQITIDPEFEHAAKEMDESAKRYIEEKTAANVAALTSEPEPMPADYHLVFTDRPGSDGNMIGETKLSMDPTVALAAIKALLVDIVPAAASYRISHAKLRLIQAIASEVVQL